MNLRKDKIGLIAGASVIAIVAIALAVVLIRVWQGFSSVNSDLQNQRARYEQMQSRDPYPSNENVARVAENAAILQQRFDALMASLLKNQIEPQSMQKAQFPPLLGETMRKLRKASDEAKVVLPVNFTMGFDRYLLLGELPQNTNDISRLVVQLKEAEKVLGIVFSVGLDEVTSFTRELFEGSAAAATEAESADPRAARRAARRGARAEDPAEETSGVAAVKKQSELYSSEHFELQVKGREEAVWRLLNEMARSEIKIVITSVQLSSDQPDIRKNVETIKTESKAAMDLAARSAGAAASLQFGANPRVALPTGTLAPVIIPSAEERVVAGREPVTAKIGFDVYRFKTPAITQETAE